MHKLGQKGRHTNDTVSLVLRAGCATFHRSNPRRFARFDDFQLTVIGSLFGTEQEGRHAFNRAI